MNLKKKEFKKINILVIGDCCVDKFVYGDVSRLAPEGPIPIFNPTSETSNPGMSGNVSRNILSLGAKSLLLSNKVQPVKTRFVDERSGQLMIRIDENDKIIIKISIKIIYKFILICSLNSDSKQKKILMNHKSS